MTQERGASVAAASKSSAMKESETTNVKETIESILVAFILAFIFRAFVVEAFVIPTGSMATTLLGAHMRFQCPDCGYVFDVNYSVPPVLGQPTQDPQIPSTGTPAGDVYCPNCGYKVSNSSELRSVQYGDRILVMKYSYLLHPPKRWDVVVFKSPDDASIYHYTQNYIKRLVGLPGEQLMVLDGDIYVAPVSEDPNPPWRIQTKPRIVQDALWRLVNDNDYYPQGLSRTVQSSRPWTQPWQAFAGTGWNLGNSNADGRVFQFANPQGIGSIRFNPNAIPTAQSLNSYLVYDGDMNEGFGVSDLKLSANYQRAAGTGPLRMILKKTDDMEHTFTAEITADSVSVSHRTPNGVKVFGSRKLADLGISSNSPIFVEFMNVDYQITLRLNGKDVIQSTPADFAPNFDWLYNHRHSPSPAGEALIEADHQTCSLEHISLWRDVYYTNNSPQHLQGTPDNPVRLKADPPEYFVMGDNSAISKDARFWNEPIKLPHEELDVEAGRVPDRFMLGQAIFVYWPAGYQVAGFSAIPDFGDMRWIH